MAYAVRRLSRMRPASATSARALPLCSSSLVSSVSSSVFLPSSPSLPFPRAPSVSTRLAPVASLPFFRSWPISPAGNLLPAADSPPNRPRNDLSLISSCAFSFSLSSLASPRSSPHRLSRHSQARFFSSEKKDTTEQPLSPAVDTSSSSCRGFSPASASLSEEGEKEKRFLQFCEVASGVVVSSPGVSAEQKQWIVSSGDDERGVKSPGGFLGVVFAFNQKFTRLKDLGFFVLLSCKQGARQALVLLSEELAFGIEERQHAARTPAQANADAPARAAAETPQTEAQRQRAPAETPGTCGSAEPGQAPGQQTAQDMVERDTAALERKLSGESEAEGGQEGKRETAGDGESRKTEAEIREGSKARENEKPHKPHEKQTEPAHADGGTLGGGASSLENLKNCLGETLLNGLQAKLAEAAESGCRLTFEIRDIQKVQITRMWTVCGAPAGHHAPIVPRSSYLVPVTPFLHAILPPAANSAFVVSPQYFRRRRGLFVKDTPEASLLEGEFDEDGEDLWPRQGEVRGETGDSGEKSADRRDRRGDGSEPGESKGGECGGTPKAPLSFPEKVRKVMERLELLDQALGKGLAVIMDVQLLCTQKFSVHDKDMKLVFGDEEDEQVVHTLRFQLTARRDGKQWGIPTFQPSSWTLVDWNGLVGTDYPCGVGALRNVVIVEKDEDMPKGQKAVYE
ncbi:hypothetical protein TGRUB_233890 [Toxoplasma gondii RUB]|uniref:Uncharacterized protein n=1 Tax=Toxoplasma gondii RUB TaxID=935652 RepID=A0A086M4W2_TOXGO|nr:hypothetical protein TGRUB_233890 [Toxoplasma gondii RUB]